MRADLKKVHRLRIPFLGSFALVRDAGEARFAHGLILGTHLSAHHYRNGRLYDKYDLGSGVVTVTLVNTLVTDAVTGSSVVPTLARFKYHDVGTSSTGATDGDTGVTTPGGPATRATGTLSNSQTATTGNHTAKLLNQGTTSFTGPVAVTEWALMDAAAQSTGNCADHRVFSVLSAISGDSIVWSWLLSIPSNG